MSGSQRRMIEDGKTETPKKPFKAQDLIAPILTGLRVMVNDSMLKFIVPVLFLITLNLFKIVKPYVYKISQTTTINDWAPIIAGSLLVIFFAFVKYLTNDKRAISEKKAYIEQEIRSYGFAHETDSLSRAFKKELDDRFDDLAHAINQMGPAVTLDESQKQEVYNAILSSTSKNLTKEFFDGIKDSVKSQIVEDKKDQLTLLNRRIDLSVKRLRDEIAQLSRRANLNLAIGSTVTVAALVSLSYFVIHEDFNSGDDVIKTLQKAAIHFVPRLSLVVFIEFFSFFFLKLYRANLHEIKYYQNELTNLEMKGSSVILSVNHGKEEDMSLVIKELVSTERNFKLQKGESTVELERNKAETHDLKEILKAALGSAAKKDK